MARSSDSKGSHAAPAKRSGPRADGAPAKKTKYEHGSKPLDGNNGVPTKATRIEQKELAKERKARRNKNFNLIQDVTGLWETLRRHDTSAAKRSELVTAILAKIKGRVSDLAGSHTASRIVQACVKHGSTKERAAILSEMEPKLLELAKSPYGRFVVSKLIDVSSKEQLTDFFKAFKGRAPELLRHPAGAHVLDDLYTSATPSQRNSLASEFYGREYALFGDGTLNNTQGAPAALRDLLNAVDSAKKRSIVQYLASTLSSVIDKGLVDCQLAHRLVAEYLEAAPASLVADAVESLSGDALLHMLHTHHGAAASCMVLAYGTAKDRKKAVRALKGHVPAAMRDEWGHLALMTALSVVDDTALLKKFIISEIQAELPELIVHKSAHKVLLQLLRPYSPRYLPPSLLDLVRPQAKVLTAGGAGAMNAAAAAESDASDDDDEAEDGQEKAQEAGPLGTSKKDPELRRKELLDGGLGQALVALCTENGAELIITQHAADVVVEVCCGGEGGVLEEVVGADAINAVHAAVVEAAAGEESTALENYFGSRAVRRAVLASTEDGASGVAAGRFVDSLWSSVIKGKCAALHKTHAAKVVGALLHCARPVAVAGAKAELKKAGVKDVDKWAQSFVVRKN